MKHLGLHSVLHRGSSILSAMVASAVFALGMGLAHQRLATQQADAGAIAEQQQAMGLAQSLAACWQRWPNPCSGSSALQVGLTLNDTVQVGHTPYTRRIRMDTVGEATFRADITISWPDARAANSDALRTWKTVVTGRYGLD